MKLLDTEYMPTNKLLEIAGTSQNKIIVSLCAAVLTIRETNMDVIVFEETRPLWRNQNNPWMDRKEITEGSLYDHIKSDLKCCDWEYRICIHEYLDVFEPTREEDKE